MSDAQTLHTVMSAAGTAGVPILLWGEPGLGKSALIEGLAAQLGAHLEVIVGSTCEPADLNGLPVVDDTGRVSFAPRSFADRLNAADKAILFLDELSTAPPASQAAMLRVVRERWVGETKLGDHVQIIAAANPADQAADGWDLAAPMANRLMHIDFAPSADDWFTGMAHGFHTLPTSHDAIGGPTGRDTDVRSAVLGFLRARPQLLQDIPTDATSAGRAWPSRRTWTYLVDVLEQLPAGDDDAVLDCLHTAITGLVGEAAGIELASFLQHFDIPDAHDVLADPTSVAWADLRTDQLFALLGTITAIATATDRTDAADVWIAACQVFGHVGRANRVDAALPSINRLLEHRPPGVTMPTEVLQDLMPMLRASGTLAAAA